MSIYLEAIMDHYTLPRNWGRLQEPTHSSRVANPLCGDVIELDLQIENYKIVKIGYETEGCAICRAAISQLSDSIAGQSIDALPYLGGTSLIDDLLKIQLSPTRMKCALLARDAIKTAINGLPINRQQLKKSQL